jgi:hypothetical protein
MWRNQAKRTKLRAERRAVHSVRYQNLRIEKSRIEFRQREDHAVTILRFRYNVAGHKLAAQLLSVRSTGVLKQHLK